MSHMKQFEHLKIQLEAIKIATNSFADESCIGRGGFGKVYKGEITHSKGQSIVAIKRLDRAFGQGDPEFWKEIMMLSLYKHENIVSLLGYCDDCGERILVYEYESKRSLDLYLNNDDLTWVQRLKICIGTARGLAYLHSPLETQLRVLHRDIKSSNILLDENWKAKISDFGLSKFGPANHQFTFLISNVVGTIGYCDPLYVETGLLTKESDVYSFGVMLFEILCGRLCFGNHEDKLPFIEWVRRCYELDTLDKIIYGNIKDEINPDSLKVFATIAYQCLKRHREERPLMTEIVRILENALEYQELISTSDQDQPLMDDTLHSGVINSSSMTLFHAQVDGDGDNDGEGDVSDSGGVEESRRAVGLDDGMDNVNFPGASESLFVTVSLRDKYQESLDHVWLLFQGELRKAKNVNKNRHPRWEEEYTITFEKQPLNNTFHLGIISTSTMRLTHTLESLAYANIGLMDIVKHNRIKKRYNLINSKNVWLQVEVKWRTHANHPSCIAHFQKFLKGKCL